MKEQIKQAFEKVTGRGLDDYEWDLLLEGDDLGMDGLDFVEFIMCLEAQLQISIPDDTAEALATPNQWLVYLNSILKESTPLTEQERPKGMPSHWPVTAQEFDDDDTFADSLGKICAWYIKHKEHVDKLVRNAERSYPPRERADVNHPELWKAEHWKWFLNSPITKKP